MKNTKNYRTLKDFTRLFGSFHELEVFACEGDLSFDAMITLLWLHGKQKNTAGNLSSSLGLSSSKTTRCLKELTAANLIDEFFDSNDFRKCFFRVSGKGTNVVYEAVGVFGEKNLTDQVMCHISLQKAAQAIKRTSGYGIASTAQKILLSLYVAEDVLTVSQICEATSLPQSRVSMALKVLQNNVFIKEGSRKSDLRMRSIELTQQGCTIASAMLSDFHYNN